MKKQAAAAGVAMTAIAVILLGAGIGYSVQRAGTGKGRNKMEKIWEDLQKAAIAVIRPREVSKMK